ncbi:MAG: YkgJ family cysteine cluster protein [Candidatus Solibacter usitatus]|nr:YkgJ family cysteine cluster protein [Candidatus Solibacter usitatus]
MPADTLQFTCIRGCTKCCEQKGWVYISDSDLLAAARFLGMKADAFEKRYVVRTRHRMRLRKPPGKQCHFLEEGGCSIHPSKPTQCRLFPFWPELVEDRKEWKRTGRYCPGIGQGPLIQIGTAVETAHEMKAAYPAMYK